MKNKKSKKSIMALILLIFFSINIIAALVPVFFAKAEDDIKIYLNKKEIKGDVAPLISNDRVLVPARMIFESLDSDVSWNEEKKEVTIINGDKEFLFKIGSNLVYINGEKHRIDVKTKIVSERTFIPLRFLAENIDMDVKWSDKERAVYITGEEEPEIPEEIDYISLEKVRLYEDKIVASFDSENIECKVLVFEEPARLVIDVLNCVNNSKSVEYGETEYYKAFRFAQFSTNPMTTRIVVELSEEFQYKIENEGEKLVIYFATEFEPEEEKEEEKKEEEKNTDKKDDSLKTVVLDAGHGGKDPGALGLENDKIILKEKDVNLEIALKVYKLLKKEDINVYITRDDDTFLELAEIVEFAESKNADLFVSIHNNASENEAVSGTMTMYAHNEAKEGHNMSGKELAKIIQKHLVKATKAKDYGPTQNSALFVVRKTTMPAVITESLFVTNEEDRNKLLDEDYIDAIANAIYEGIMEALKHTRVEHRMP